MKGGRCLIRSAHNKATRKYEKQRLRTEANKKKRKEWQEEIRNQKRRGV